MPLSVVLRGIFSALFVASVLRISTPIILSALGGLISDVAGVINIALEGIMLVSAFTGVMVSATTHSVWLGVLAGICAGVLTGLRCWVRCTSSVTSLRKPTDTLANRPPQPAIC